MEQGKPTAHLFITSLNKLTELGHNMIHDVIMPRGIKKRAVTEFIKMYFHYWFRMYLFCRWLTWWFCSFIDFNKIVGRVKKRTNTSFYTTQYNP